MCIRDRLSGAGEDLELQRNGAATLDGVHHVVHVDGLVEPFECPRQHVVRLGGSAGAPGQVQGRRGESVHPNRGAVASDGATIRAGPAISRGAVSYTHLTLPTIY